MQWFPNIKSILQLNPSELPHLCRAYSLSLMPLKGTTIAKHMTDLEFWLQNIAMCGKLSRVEWVAVYRQPPKGLPLMGTAQRITLLSSHLRQCLEELSVLDESRTHHKTSVQMHLLLFSKFVLNSNSPENRPLLFKALKAE